MLPLHAHPLPGSRSGHRATLHAAQQTKPAEEPRYSRFRFGDFDDVTVHCLTQIRVGQLLPATGCSPASGFNRAFHETNTLDVSLTGRFPLVQQTPSCGSAHQFLTYSHQSSLPLGLQSDTGWIGHDHVGSAYSESRAADAHAAVCKSSVQPSAAAAVSSAPPLQISLSRCSSSRVIVQTTGPAAALLCAEPQHAEVGTSTI